MVIFFNRIKADWVLNDFTVLIEPICDAISSCVSRVKDMPEETDTISKDLIIDDESCKVDNLIGLSFVVCQIYITSFVSGVRKRYSEYLSEHPEKIPSITIPQKRELLEMSRNIFETSKITKIKMLDAFANYYKHQDEWGCDWNNPSPQSKYTIELLQSQGLNSGDTGNFRTAADLLGNTTFTEWNVYYDILKEWIDSVGEKLAIDLMLD